MIDFLHYLIMFSQTYSGIKAKDFDSLRREFLLVGAKKGFSPRPTDFRGCRFFCDWRNRG